MIEEIQLLLHCSIRKVLTNLRKYLQAYPNTNKIDMVFATKLGDNNPTNVSFDASGMSIKGLVDNFKSFLRVSGYDTTGVEFLTPDQIAKLKSTD